MLIISRKVDEGLIIDGEIKIIVIGIEGNKVKLGIKAPKNITILREEVVEAVKEENRLAVEVCLEEIDFNDFKIPQR
ncbi:MAG: carbon storage regulator CsrA [Bacillota bacterium]